MVGTNKKYAAIHQFGGMVGNNKKLYIPSRSLFKLDEKEMSQINNIILKYLDKK